MFRQKNNIFLTYLNDIIKKIVRKKMSTFEVNKKKFIELFRNEYIFEIPEYQRPFSWEEKQLNDLFDDLGNALNRKYSEYLLGTVYLQKEYDNTFKILDGQQRFISMYLLLKSLDYKSLPNLKIGKNDNEFFQKLIEGKEENPSSASQKRLKKALELFKSKITNKNDILNFIEKNLSIIVTIVNDQKIAITTFITQTDRGKRLTNLEKLKSILYYYKLQIDEENQKFEEIESLFGKIYQSLNKLYNKPETSEADILRVLMIRLEQDQEYRKSDFKKLLGQKYDNNFHNLPWEAGEDEIFIWMQRVLSNFHIDNEYEKRNLVIALNKIITILIAIEKNLKYYVDNFNKSDLKNLFLSLNPSRFSRAFLVDYLNSSNHINFFESFEEVSKEPKLQEPNIPDELNEYFNKIKRSIEGYKKEFTKKNIFNFIERAELSCWKIGKRPVGNFLGYKVEKAQKHLIKFSNEYKNSYFLRDLGYGNYKYVLMAYEAYHNKDFKIESFYSVMSENNEIIKVHREHIFAQNPIEEIWNEIKQKGFSENKTNYNNWIWNIGNIALLSEGDNIKVSNETPWKKAEYYKLQTNFTTTQILGNDILKYCKNDKEQFDLNLLKNMLDIREYELKMFAWYRF